jgi:hypothetical protein
VCSRHKYIGNKCNDLPKSCQIQPTAAASLSNNFSPASQAHPRQIRDFDNVKINEVSRGAFPCFRLIIFQLKSHSILAYSNFASSEFSRSSWGLKKLRRFSFSPALVSLRICTKQKDLTNSISQSLIITI